MVLEGALKRPRVSKPSAKKPVAVTALKYLGCGRLCRLVGATLAKPFEGAVDPVDHPVLINSAEPSVGRVWVLQ